MEINNRRTKNIYCSQILDVMIKIVESLLDNRVELEDKLRERTTSGLRHDRSVELKKR